MSQKDDGSKESTEQKKDAVSRRKFVVGTVGGLVVGAVAGAAVGSLGFPQTIEKTLTATSTATATETATKTATETSTAISTATQTATKTATETSTVTTVATPSFLTPTAPIPDSQISKTVQTEVVVIGAGTSGLVCANAAVESGAKVVVISKDNAPVARGGSNHAYNTTLLKKLGFSPNIGRDFKKEMLPADYRIDQDKWKLWAQRSGEAVDWISAKMVAAGYTPVIERTYTDPDDDIITQPVGSHSWVGDGITGAGAGQPLVVKTLAQTATAAGVQIDYSTTAVQLVRENNNTGRVTAVIAQAPDKTYTKYVGSKAVVLATGDFTTDKEMVATYCPMATGLTGGVYSGDGHKMGLWVGAAWQKVTPNAPMLSAAFDFLAAPYMPLFPPCLVVNANGDRFVNEDCLGALGGTAMLNEPGHKAFAVWDVNYAQSAAPWYGMGAYYGPEPGQETPPMAVADVLAAWDKSTAATPPSIVKANTIADLATALGLPSDALSATVARYNGFSASGVDEDYHKRPGLLFPVNTPPFYGSPGGIFLLIVTGGLRTNTNMQVLDTNDQVIPGLYAVGTIVGDMFAGIYTFGLFGQNLGATCDTFGYVAGQYIAQNE